MVENTVTFKNVIKWELHTAGQTIKKSLESFVR